MFHDVSTYTCDSLQWIVDEKTFPPNIACGLADSGRPCHQRVVFAVGITNRSKARRVEESLLETAAAASNAERELQEHNSR